MKSLQLSEIWIYPIKSLGGISLKECTFLGKGLKLDRRWMLIDGDNVCMTQRTFSKMALFKISVDKNMLKVAYEKDEISIPINNNTNSSGTITAKIFDDVVIVEEVNANYSEWFSAKLGTSCKLVYFPEENARPVDPEYKLSEDHVSLADAFPFLIIGQRSLDDLNERLDEPLPMNRFRPNFVFTGGEPFEEDSWKEFTLGDYRFVAIKPCARCAITTVNQETGLKGKEPLKTFSSFRMRNNKIYFGQNLLALSSSGLISIGDLIIPQG